MLGTLLDWTNKPVKGLGAVELWPLSELPLLGKLFVQNPLVFMTPLIVLAVVWFLTRSTTGLRLRAVGRTRRRRMPRAFPCSDTGWQRSSPVRR